MEVSVLSEKLAKGLSFVVRVVPSRPSLPILANVLLEAKEGSLLLVATDLNLGIKLRIGAKVKKEGSIAVPAKVFEELVASFPPATVELSVEGESVLVKCASHKARVSGIGAADYPALGKMEKGGELVLPAAKLREAVGLVAFAASSDETRPVLSGVLWRFQDGGLQLVATDGYRLSMTSFDVPPPKGEGKGRAAVKAVVGDGFIVPARALREVERLAGELEPAQVRVRLVSDQKLALFLMGEGEVTTRLVEGEFPNFSQVLPTQEGSVAEVELEPLVKAVRTAAIFARDSANIVHWKLTKEGLTLSANAPSYGESESKVEVVLSGDGGETAFNSRYLLELLSLFPSKKVRFSMNGSLDPGVFRVGGEEQPFLHLIMPVRVQG